MDDDLNNEGKKMVLKGSKSQPMSKHPMKSKMSINVLPSDSHRPINMNQIQDLNPDQVLVPGKQAMSQLPVDVNTLMPPK
jgi:hypothetical protein